MSNAFSEVGVSGQDVTQRAAQNEVVLAGQKRALERALSGAPLKEVLEVLVRTVESQSTDGVAASILLLDAQTKRLHLGAAPSLPEPYNAAIEGLAIGPDVGSCGTAAFSKKTVVVRDIQSDALWANFKGLAAEHGLRACWSTPVFSSSGVVLATFALYHRTPTAPDARDQEIVALLGQTAALLIERDQQAQGRALAEAQLQRSRQEELARIQSMYTHAPAAIAVLRGPELVFEVANPRYRELVGGREVLGKSLREALPEIDGQGFFELLDGVRTTGKPFVGRSVKALLKREASIPTEGFFDFVYQPLPGPDGTVDDILVVAFEVTDLVRARLAAEESERQLRTFVDTLPELAWTALPDGHIDYYNRRWYDYTGTTFEEMQGWGWEKVHDPKLLPLVAERWKHSLQTGEPFEMEFTLRGADGIARWFLTRVAPSRDSSGKIVRWFGTNTNIDALRSAKALTEAVSEQSREAETLLLEMRAQRDRAEARVAELESQLRGKAGRA